MNYENDLSRFDGEGGAMTPTTPFKAEEPIREFSEDYPGSMVIAYALVALSGAFVGALLVWLVS